MLSIMHFKRAGIFSSVVETTGAANDATQNFQELSEKLKQANVSSLFYSIQFTNFVDLYCL